MTVVAQGARLRPGGALRRLTGRAANGPALDDTIAQMRKLAALLRSGLTPQRALELARAGGGWLPGQSPAATQPARVFEALWRIAAVSGAPVADALEQVADALAALSALAARRRVLLAGPRSTLTLICCLPVLALLFGELLGFAPLAVLAGPAGPAIVAVGGLLLVTGVLWSRRMIRAVARAERPIGLECALLAVALRGGLPVPAARLLVIDSIDRSRAEWVSLAAFADTGLIARVLAEADAAGQPHVPALREAGERERRAAVADMEERAEKLAIRALLPLSVCVLPAFAVLGVLPIVLSMLGLVTVDAHGGGAIP